MTTGNVRNKEREENASHDATQALPSLNLTDTKIGLNIQKTVELLTGTFMNMKTFSAGQQEKNS